MMKKDTYEMCQIWSMESAEAFIAGEPWVFDNLLKNLAELRDVPFEELKTLMLVLFEPAVYHLLTGEVL